MPKPVDKSTPPIKSTQTGYNWSLTEEVPVEQPPQSPYNKEVKLQLCIDAHAHYDGPVTGKHYEWARAGSIVVVDALDAPILLEKRIKAQSCCSGSDNPVFQIVD